MASNGTTNGTTNRKIPLRPGLYAPILTFFDSSPSESLDLPTLSAHTVRLAKGGLVGIVAMGSNGEAVHLLHSERSAVISTIRKALDGNGFTDVPVIAGCSAQSVVESVQLSHEAAAAGASYILNLSPSYYVKSMTPDVIASYFTSVADASPLPVLMYNYPGAVAGVDMDSDLLVRLSRHANICGAKLTCGNVGKLTRLAAATDAITAKSAPGASFLATGGLADMTIQTAASGGSGIIAGSANVFPRACVRVWDLWARGDWDAAMALQKVVAQADGVLAKSVVPATKAALVHYCGYGGAPRRPLPAVEGKEAQYFIDGIKEAMKIEVELEGKS